MKSKEIIIDGKSLEKMGIEQLKDVAYTIGGFDTSKFDKTVLIEIIEHKTKEIKKAADDDASKLNLKEDDLWNLDKGDLISLYMNFQNKYEQHKKDLQEILNFKNRYIDELKKTKPDKE